MEIRLPSDSRLIFEAEYHPAVPEKGEWMYSLGQPAEPASYEITAVAWETESGATDITDFVVQYSDKLFKQWEDELND